MTKAGSLNTGGRYDPANDSWTPTSATDAPSGRFNHTAIWTGNLMIIWGGQGLNPFAYFQTGGRYDPVTDTWTSTSTTNAPRARYGHTAVWTGTSMVIWAGTNDIEVFDSGGRYDPISD